MEENSVIVRYSEVAVKGPGTRGRMERLLASHIHEALRRRGVDGRVERVPGRILIVEPSDAHAASKAAARVFGVKSASPAYMFHFQSLQDLVEKAASFFASRVAGKSFRVTARRAGTHDFTSLDVERELGARLLEAGAGRVDLHNPEYVAYVEIRGSTAFAYDTVVEGPGGLPLGSEDPLLVLYSGGFDSTVAWWLVMKRGSPADLLYYDLGVPEALETAREAAERVASEWVHGRRPRLYVARIVWGEDSLERVRPRYRALVVRRVMLEEAEKIAVARGYEGLVTGESIGQVATQTVRNLRLIGSGLRLPVIRPVSGMDKDEVAALSRRIGVYDIVSRQVEACRAMVDPTPRGDPRVFEEELAKVRGKYRVLLEEEEV